MNVLLVTADQWRGDCLSCLGHPAVRTPNLDRLAADGVLFTRHFAQATPCGPSRASLHTGLYALNHRSITNGTPLDARHKTLAGLARAGRLRSGPVRLHRHQRRSAHAAAGQPVARTYEGVAPGFRVELRLPEAEDAYLDHLADRGYGRRSFAEVYGGGFRQPAPFRAEDSVTAFLADRFLGWLDGQGAAALVRPCRVPQAAPALRGAGALVLVRGAGSGAGTGARADGRGRRLPCIRGSRRISHMPDRRRRPACAARWRQPRPVARGLFRAGRPRSTTIWAASSTTLARRGELDSTLVIVTSDHGEMLGDHWMLGKAGFFPQAFHVPLLDPPPGRRARPARDGVHRACRSHADRTDQPRAARPASM